MLDLNCEDLYKQLQNAEMKIEYMTEVINVYKTKQNIGEKDELLSILHLCFLNKTQQYHELVKIFGNSACEGIEVIDLNTNLPIEYKDVRKSKANSKSDMYLKMNKTKESFFVSIKSRNGASPTILNHTPRTAKVFQKGGELHNCLGSLDILLCEYITKRSSMVIGEDVKITELDSFNNEKIFNDVVCLLVYFIFDGTGKGPSTYKANSILFFDNSKIEFCKCTMQNEKVMYAKSIIERCILSLREKGTPNNILTGDPWNFVHSNGANKASLHIRMR